MTFNLRRLDSLTYDEAEPLLEGYIEGAIETFLNFNDTKIVYKIIPDFPDFQLPSMDLQRFIRKLGRISPNKMTEITLAIVTLIEYQE